MQKDGEQVIKWADKNPAEIVIWDVESYNEHVGTLLDDTYTAVARAGMSTEENNCKNGPQVLSNAIVKEGMHQVS